MRLFFSFFLGAAVLALAFWAYQENYHTRETIAEQRRIQSEIGRLREQLSVLRAEWAYLNRPERLRELTSLNFETLQLLPMTPDHFGRLEQVAFPPRAIPQMVDGQTLIEGILPVSQAETLLTGAAQ
ncbi:hypothetical protein [Pseudoruegeria sp. SK021]|uniref:cell division protein FtsL n=1 Tax=Pseudoruegeria sp. SK021 TaxID=1933035 RepID=UPI000A225B0A|nr:hypothetical protein [Pseudoruegeria sp. SK021]OSP55000.1 hypothetical protein BV911_10150 [Pseudoruegeria sp. SK021]